jgi:hypothetical protein
MIYLTIYSCSRQEHPSLRGAGGIELRFACDEAISWITKDKITAIQNQIASPGAILLHGSLAVTVYKVKAEFM